MNILNDHELAQRKSSLAPLYKALAAARVEFDEIPRTRVATVRMKAGGQYSYKYADLADVFRAITPALAAHGLLVMQYPEGGDIVTVIAHESGAEKSVTWPIKPMPQRGLDDCQSFQTSVQVAKRYALTAALGISTEETIEGDEKAHRHLKGGQPSGDTFVEPDGIRSPVGAKITPGMTKPQMAKEAARAIEALFLEPKTKKGLEGVWARNQRFIDVLKQDYAQHFDDVYDAFNARLFEIEGDSEHG